MEYYNQKALQEIRQDSRIELLQFPDEVLQELQAMTLETLDEEAAVNPAFKRVYDAYRNFRNQYMQWTRLSEDAYQDILRGQ
jgi:TRAP-type mannitol/chloroaromatic compound transport system substrate-binding protein